MDVSVYKHCNPIGPPVTRLDLHQSVGLRELPCSRRWGFPVNGHPRLPIPPLCAFLLFRSQLPLPRRRLPKPARWEQRS